MKSKGLFRARSRRRDPRLAPSGAELGPGWRPRTDRLLRTQGPVVKGDRSGPEACRHPGLGGCSNKVAFSLIARDGGLQLADTKAGCKYNILFVITASP